jgi:hypothetical protein
LNSFSITHKGATGHSIRFGDDLLHPPVAPAIGIGIKIRRLCRLQIRVGMGEVRRERKRERETDREIERDREAGKERQRERGRESV